MHGFSRLGSPSSNSSPPASPRCRHARTKSFSPSSIHLANNISIPHVSKPRLFNKVLFCIVSAVFRRRGVLLLAPLFYISGMMLYMGSFNFDVVNLKNAVVVVQRPAPPGSVYRSPQVFDNLWPFMQSESQNFSQNVISSVWNSKFHSDWKPCMNDINESATTAELSKSNGFLIIEANGGLNQQRLSICDAVAVAGLMNATLVIPIFHLNSVWRDSRWLL